MCVWLLLPHSIPSILTTNWSFKLDFLSTLTKHFLINMLYTLYVLKEIECKNDPSHGYIKLPVTKILCYVMLGRYRFSVYAGVGLFMSCSSDHWHTDVWFHLNSETFISNAIGLVYFFFPMVWSFRKKKVQKKGKFRRGAIKLIAVVCTPVVFERLK